MAKPAVNTIDATVSCVDPRRAVVGPQGQLLIPVVDTEACGTTRLSAGAVYMPPGRWSKPHVHADSDIIVVVLDGQGASLVGPKLRPVFHGPGQFMFIPAGMVHVAVNLSTTRPLTALEVRTDPAFNEDVVLLPEYQPGAQHSAVRLQSDFESGQLKLTATENLVTLSKTWACP